MSYNNGDTEVVKHVINYIHVCMNHKKTAQGLD